MTTKIPRSAVTISQNPLQNTTSPHEKKTQPRLFRQSIGKAKSSNLQNGLISGRPEAKGLHAAPLGHPMSGGCATFHSIRRLVEFDEETFVRSLPAEDVSTRGEGDFGD
jgi:hypothetical protein